MLWHARTVSHGLIGFALACSPSRASADSSAPMDTTTASALAPVGPPPDALRRSLGLSSRYTKHVDAGGIPVLASSGVDDAALREARYLILQMIGHRPDVLRAIASQRMRFVVMAPSEMTTDVPEHADLTPKSYWDRRARGLGATAARPATSCGEENLVELPGDPYSTENILVHEFGHTVQQMGMSALDPTFDRRLDAAFAHARATGLWKGTYAGTNAQEYWAEATQSWFDTNRVNDNEHGPIDTRDKLIPYDPDIVVLLREAYGDRPWRYMKPSHRPASDRAHLAGFDARKAGSFKWPADLPALGQPTASRAVSLLGTSALPSRSPQTTERSTLLVTNHRKSDIALDWLDFAGGRKRYAVIRPGTTASQSTYAGHVWIVSEAGRDLGGAAAPAGDAQLDLR